MCYHTWVSLSTHTVILVTVLPSLLYNKEYCRTDLQSIALSKVHTLKVLLDPVLTSGSAGQGSHCFSAESVPPASMV